jgi:transposase-like protein
MGEPKKRAVYGPAFKAEVGLEAIRAAKTIHQIARDFGVHHVQVSQWKRKILQRACDLFDRKSGSASMIGDGEFGHLRNQVAGLEIELANLANKVLIVSAIERTGWMDSEDELPLTRQCQLAGINRATFYARRKRHSERGAGSK